MSASVHGAQGMIKGSSYAPQTLASSLWFRLASRSAGLPLKFIAEKCIVYMGRKRPVGTA
jgi:hypothetical protein